MTDSWRQFFLSGMVILTGIVCQYLSVVLAVLDIGAVSINELVGVFFRG